MFSQYRAALALPLSCAVFAAQAQTNLDPVVVTASRIAQPLSEAIPATTVLSAEQIRASGAPDLATLLARQAGLEISQQGGTGTQASVFMRGSESRMTLVLVDGVPINTLNFSQASIAQISLAGIERIEIVRGNVSALYGAQATGGVIQIFTATGREGFAASAALAAGSRGTREAVAQLSGGAQGFTYSATANTQRTKGFSALDPAKVPGTNPDADGSDSTTLGASLGYAFNPQHSVTLSHRHTRGDVQYDSEFGPPDQADESRQALTTTVLTSRNKLGALQSDLRLAVTRDGLDARITAFRYQVVSRAALVGWQNDYTVAAGQVLSANLERTRQKIKSDTAYDQDSRTLTSYALGYRGDVGAHGWQLNLRRDDYSDFGSANTYYAGYGLKFAQQWRASVAASSAFNAPTFNDLYFPGFSNPALKPETARAKELALQWQAGGQRVRVAAFENRYRDLIGFDSSFNIVNINRAKNRGVELIAETTLAGVDLRASVTSQNPRDEAQDKPLLRRAKKLGAVTASYNQGAWTASSTLRLVGARPDRGNRTLAGYGTLDASVAYALYSQLSLTLRAQNLANRTWQDAFGYNNTPRTVIAGIEGRI
jgi:vitamin B12 transporter